MIDYKKVILSSKIRHKILDALNFVPDSIMLPVIHGVRMFSLVRTNSIMSWEKNSCYLKNRGVNLLLLFDDYGNSDLLIGGLS